MYKTITSQIMIILQGISAVKAIYPHPIQGTTDKSPCVIFFQVDGGRVYSTNTENENTYKYKMWVGVDTAGTTLQKVWSDILPSTVDKIIAEFDEKYKSVIDGKRSWLIIDSENWGISTENNGLKCYAVLSLTFKVCSDI